MNNWKSIFGSAWFYAVLALCVLAVGVGGSFALFAGRDKPAEESVPRRTDLITPSVVEPAAPEIPAVVETIAPAGHETEETPEQETPPPMPERPVDDTPVVVEAPRLIVSPLNGEVVTVFSVDQLVYNETLADWRTHDGMDLAVSLGTKVIATAAGTVSKVFEDPFMGTTVEIDHGKGLTSQYANLAAVPDVAVGDTVSTGPLIGSVGATAAAENAVQPHLHFAMYQDGNPVSPHDYLPER